MLRINLSPIVHLAALAWLAGSWGCAGHRLPAIDPSGQRIFSGASTTIVSPITECPLWNRSPPPSQPPVAAPPIAVPAFPATCPPPLAAVAQPIPQPAPVCNTPPPRPAPVSAPCPTSPPGPIVMVTPKEIVAPVCSEVIVAAGLCDSRGYYLTGQPLEWMIPAGSIGQIVQVGKETRTGFTGYLRGSPEKVATNYVRATTSSMAQAIDRGTPNPLDDVSLVKGQSWISVTSPTEGTTHVTVWAPKEKDWERRRTTARIHWVDAKWTFPAPQTSRFGQPVRLTTRIMRSSGAPLAGWRVRYDVLDGPEASFGVGGQKSIDPPTLADGTATVELLPGTTTPGITQVRVQIVRPSTGRDGLPDMVVGQGLTSVAWSSPGLAVQAFGPETVPVSGTLSYRVDVVNNGDLAARDVRLSFVPPQSVSVLSSTPAASPLGQTLVWRLGDLRPRSTTSVQVNCQANMAADIRACFRAESAERVTAESCVSSRVFASALSIQMTGPETAEVGQTAQFRISLTNTSRSPLTNVRVRDTYDPGLSEVNGKQSPLELDYEQILPGETKQIGLTFTVDEPGKQCHRLDVSTDGGHTASARGCVTGVPARSAPSPMPAAARVSVEIQAAPQIEVGKAGLVQVDIVNQGAAELTNVELLVEHPASLDPTSASPGASPEENSISWKIDSIGPGQRATRQIEYSALAADPRAIVRATVVSDQSAEQSREATIRVVTPVITPPAGGKSTPMGSSPPPAANANNLKITAADNPDPVKSGAEVTYLIDISNAGLLDDREVVVTFSLPAGFTYKSFSTRTINLQVQAIQPSGSGRYQLTPIATIGAGEKLDTITLKATAGASGKATLKINGKSALNPRGIDFTTETTVLP